MASEAILSLFVSSVAVVVGISSAINDTARGVNTTLYANIPGDRHARPSAHTKAPGDT